MASFRKGDTVTLTATVKYRFSDGEAGDVLLDIDGHYQTIGLPPAKLKLLHAFFQSGDWISWGDDSDIGQVIAVSEQLVWVRAYANALHHTFHISEIKHAEAPSQVGAAA